MRIPYDFVPVSTTEAEPWLDEPVRHDGTQIDEGGLLSGELRCTLTALTPLIVGNRRSLVGKDEGLSSDEIRTLQRELGGSAFPTGKAILEPLRLSDGRVAISGTAIKGMLRQGLGALLGAPMERVMEHAYTYRPNLDPSSRPRNKLQVRAAVVNGEDEGTLSLTLLPEGENVEFHPGADDEPKPMRDGFLTCPYYGGIDGEGLLARAHNSNARTYQWAMIPRRLFENAELADVPKDVVDAYLKTQTVLADDVTGHLRGHPKVGNFAINDVKAAIGKSATDALKPDTLLYVEVDVSERAHPRVLSIGHHFRYRWAYTSTVRERRGGLEPAARRAVLSPHPREVVPLSEEERNGAPETDRAPERLTGARLLFGYVRVDPSRDDAATSRAATEGIGSGIYRQLSGRIAVNMAVERPDPDEDPATDTRFLDPERACAVPLRILGQPRPSAVERYIDGNRNKSPIGREPLATYGDTLDESGGELAGRKLYVHQPEAATNLDLYRDDTKIASDQATIVRYVSKPNTAFLFTLRFRDLRLRELGALLVALDPRRLRPAKTPPDDDSNPSHALKLGYARPLGLGSVLVTVDSAHRVGARCRLEQDDGLVGRAVDAFTTEIQPKLDKKIVEQWLAVHRYKGMDRAHYAPPQDGEIYKHHMNYRKNHARRRREQ